VIGMSPVVRSLLAIGLVLASGSAPAQLLTVSAAASMSESLKEIGAGFEAGHAGVTLRFNFAASGPLLQQIVHGAPADVFVSADEETVAKGIEQKVLDPATRRVFAGNVVVLIRPAGNRTVNALADLARPEVKRVAIGKPASVPVGRYTQQGLAAAALWEPLQPKIVPGDSVRQVLDYVARGEVEAGFVYATDAAVMAEKVQVVMTLPGHAPVLYPALVVAESRNKALAAGFVRYLAGAEAQAVLARRGFGKP
jgi:molybdate transport system substrate-binding protein